MRPLILILLALTKSAQALASEGPSQIKSRMDTISIFESEYLLPSEVGEGHKVNQSTLKINNDIHQILKSIPGVFVQEEEGEGHRPNIGLRGTHPHRSKKITLMEDNVLIAPAPYSAPAAYYFPIMENIQGIEVFKGPSSAKYGPNSIGGAINLKSRDYLLEHRLKSTLHLGSFEERLIDVVFSDQTQDWHWLIHGTYNDSQGFKNLENGGSTGFVKGNAGFKVKKILSKKNASFLEFKFNVSSEDSNETYLGLTSEDFSDAPMQRYAGSQNDNLLGNFRQYQINFSHSIGDNLGVLITTYHHEFDRNWSRFNGFANNDVNINDLLDNPMGGLESYYLILRGQENTLNDQQNLVIANNDRSYASRGLQTDLTWHLPTTETLTYHGLDFGYRIHYDKIERRHTNDYFAMLDGDLIPTAFPRAIDRSGQNRDQSLSQSLYSHYRFDFKSWETATTLRYDFIKSQRTSLIDSYESQREDSLLTPGLQVAYNYNSFQVFSGIHRGMNLVGPGQQSSVKPEESLNYELGLRTKMERGHFELASFFNHYTNIVSVCTFASGCSADNLDQKFNGGAAIVYGLEVATGYQLQYQTWLFPLSFNTTLTTAQFDNSFESESEEWGQGTIQKGDPLPYIPQVQVHLNIGIKKAKWSLTTSIKYQGKSFDQALQENRKMISPFGVIDLMAEYDWKKEYVSFIRLNNLLNHEYVTSYRPFGARPGKPLTVLAGVTISL